MPAENALVRFVLQAALNMAADMAAAGLKSVVRMGADRANVWIERGKATLLAKVFSIMNRLLGDDEGAEGGREDGGRADGGRENGGPANGGPANDNPANGGAANGGQ